MSIKVKELLSSAVIKLMLTYSNMSIQQIADYLHFPSHSNFGRYFKQRAGISPGAYREQVGVLGVASCS